VSAVTKMSTLTLRGERKHYLEKRNGEDEGPLAIKDGEHLSIEEEEGRLGEEVGRGDPSELVEGVVLRGGERSASSFGDCL
jgi:hypothetical protein